MGSTDGPLCIIPHPLELQRDEGLLVSRQPPLIHHHQELAAVAQYLHSELTRLSLKPKIWDDSRSLDGEARAACIQLVIEGSMPQLQRYRGSDEGYYLSTTAEEGVRIKALTPQGVFYGIQTLLQILQVAEEGYQLPLLQVVDVPRFMWRGVLLDVGRHFFSVAFIKRVLDVMARYKMNRLHWHLTEDQGWRLEVKSLLRLTEVGCWRGQDAQRHGGYYTQEQVRDIVKYAAERCIEVVPEIELPGHCGAALASYPNLSCAGNITEVPVNWGIHEDVYCAGNPEVFVFLENVLDEVMELFPYQYIHIGGDECPKSRWEQCPKCQQRIEEEGLADESELQSWFIKKVSKHLESKGRKIIGWDEILEGGLAPGATVMSWRGTAGGVIAARAGHNVIMTPTSHCYFDYRQAASGSEPGAWYACLPLEVVYSYDPVVTGPHAMALAPAAAAASAATSGEEGRAQEQEEEEEGGVAECMDVSGEIGGAVAALGAGEGAVEQVPPSSSEAPVGSSAGAAGGSGSGSRADAGADGGCSGEQDSSGGGSLELPKAGLSVAVADRDTSGPASMIDEEGGSPSLISVTAPCSPVKLSAPYLSAEEAQRVLGSQANLWTEYVPDEHTAEYMLLPRLLAMAEAVWSPPKVRSWQGFKQRLQPHFQVLQEMGCNYRPLD